MVHVQKVVKGRSANGVNGVCAEVVNGRNAKAVDGTCAEVVNGTSAEVVNSRNAEAVNELDLIYHGLKMLCKTRKKGFPKILQKSRQSPKQRFVAPSSLYKSLFRRLISRPQ